MKSEQTDGVLTVRAALSVIGGKWTVRILWHLKEEPKRYGELRQRIPEVSEKMLIQKLRELEENEIVTRKVLSEKPIKIEYHFTDYGKTLVPVFQALCDWGEKHLERTNSKHDSSAIQESKRS